MVDPKKAVDILKPKLGISILIRKDGKVVWANVDGVCMLRVLQPPKIVIEDQRKAHPLRHNRFLNKQGQGHVYAKNHESSVVVECELSDAHNLADMFLDQFSMPSCLYYDGYMLAMCFSEAGSGAELLKARIESFTEGYFKAKGGKKPKIITYD